MCRCEYRVLPIPYFFRCAFSRALPGTSPAPEAVSAGKPGHPRSSGWRCPRPMESGSRRAEAVVNPSLPLYCGGCLYTGSLRAVGRVLRAKLDARKNPRRFLFVFIDLSLVGWASARNSVTPQEPIHRERIRCWAAAPPSLAWALPGVWGQRARPGPAPVPRHSRVPGAPGSGDLAPRLPGSSVTGR